MKKRLVVILLLQVLGFRLVSEQLGLANSRLSPDCSLSQVLCGYDSQIDITPALPTMKDAVGITVSGIWPDSCVPEYQSHQVLSNTIRIDAVVSATTVTVCLLVVLPWEFTVGVGTLFTGSYQVDLYIADHRYTQTPILCTSKSFTVFDQLHTAYLPVVTK